MVLSISMKLIVGLGNPGEKYEHTRHNLGFMIVDQFVKKHMANGVWHMETKFNAEIIKDSLFGKDLILARPQTFMNNSGISVAAIANFFKIDPSDIIVIYDDVDLKFGQIKLRLGGSAAGHHGVESIIEKIGTDQFLRLRGGIGNDKTTNAEDFRSSTPTDEYVIAPFDSGQTNDVKHMIKKAIDALEVLLEKGLESAQNQYH
jgi:peptidyl-tRNA hydrolase, PTH1 family